MAEAAARWVRWAVLAGAALFLVAIGVLVILIRSPLDSVPAIDRPSFSFVVVGDFGTGGEDEIAVAEEMEAWVEREGADALLTTGDNVYPEGDPAYFPRAWDEPYGWTDRLDVDVFASLGNHDFDYQGGAAVVDHLDMPGIWYRRSLSDADVFILDANRISDPSQTEWLSGALERSQATWKIVAFHQPAYSCSTHGGTDEVVDRWVPVFEEGGVDLVLNGHDHNYQRFAERNGVTYVVTGGGGAQLYPLEECDEDAPEHASADDSEHHFVVVEGDRTRLRGRAVTAQGEILDDFELERTSTAE